MRISDWSSDVCSSDLTNQPSVAFLCKDGKDQWQLQTWIDISRNHFLVQGPLRSVTGHTCGGLKGVGRQNKANLSAIREQIKCLLQKAIDQRKLKWRISQDESWFESQLDFTKVAFKYGALGIGP